MTATLTGGERLSSIDRLTRGGSILEGPKSSCDGDKDNITNKQGRMAAALRCETINGLLRDIGPCKWF